MQLGTRPPQLMVGVPSPEHILCEQFQHDDKDENLIKSKFFSTDIDSSISLQAAFHIPGLLDVQPQSILIQSVAPLLRLVLEFLLYLIHQKDVMGIK
uniref:Uncharacterized protein n=1 Tax=Romanomermis culicivorax TaxID=13658 RepID=A0A915JNY0_ROMCU